MNLENLKVIFATFFGFATPCARGEIRVDVYDGEKPF
jgi:hypothetical protein